MSGGRAKTIGAKELRRELREERERGVVDLDLERLRRELEAERPKTRADCDEIRRPCPFFACRWNLYLDVNPATGSIKFNFPGLEFWELEETCALDVADHGGVTLERVGELLNVSRERIRQVETSGLEVLARRVRSTP